VKSEYEKKKLHEEINVQTRMREKAEMRLEVEVQKSQLSERLRKEATEESQLLTQKCHQLEDDLDLLQKQY
jgi:microsomal dipeptidase-like Zn-dependent dipeptidase